MSLKEFRKKSGITQEELAYATNVSVRTIQNIEKRNNTDIKTALRIATVLGANIEEIFFPELKKKTRAIALISNERL